MDQPLIRTAFHRQRQRLSSVDSQRGDQHMAEIPRRTLLTGAAATAVGAAVAPALGAPALASQAARCDPPGNGEFFKVGGNYGNQNYSSLGRVHHGNVHRLGGAWLNRIEGGLTTGNNQSTAVVADG